VPTQIPGAYRASIAPDASGLLVIENQYGRHPLWFQPLPAGDARKMAKLEAQGTAFMPDGKQFVYTDGATVNIADRDGSNAHKLADLPGLGYWPAVSPDGKEIRVTVAAGDSAWLWEMGSDGTGFRRLAIEGKDLSNPAYGRWTPDGRYFVFNTFHEEGRSDIWAIQEKPEFLHRSSPVPIQLTKGPLECGLPTPSRDGKQIFSRCAKLRGELVRYDRRSRQFVPALGGISASDLEYSRDGTWVVYLSYPDRSVWRMRADGSDRLRLTYPPVTGFYPHISPDGTKIAFSLRGHGPKSGLYIVNAAGGEPQKIVGGPIPDSPSWSPDGDYLAFDTIPSGMHTEQEATEVRVVDLRTGKVSVIPQSRGKCLQVWATKEALVATSDDGTKVFRYDFNIQAWSDLGNGPYSDCSSTDGNYVYCVTMEPAPPAAMRIRVTDGQLEKLADLSGLKRIVTYGSRELSLTPNGELLFTHDIGTQEIYALNIRWR
jgi:dipeptidyl aminopeptidase/acylaminoacyl peptidase